MFSPVSQASPASLLNATGPIPGPHRACGHRGDHSLTQERALGASELQLQSSATATAEAGAAAGGVTDAHTAVREVLRTTASTRPGQSL